MASKSKVKTFKIWHIKSRFLRKIFILGYVPFFVTMVFLLAIAYAFAGFYEHFKEFLNEHLLDTGFIQNMKICWKGEIPDDDTSRNGP